MCGINGLISVANKDTPTGIAEKLSMMNNLIIHRGPDQDGFYIHNSENVSVGMAMRRLSIIDLSTGKQPMQTEDGKINLIFNGEIYNYQTLKKELQKEGIQFHTTSDTEVILRLYEKYGTKSFSMLDGMFAFSIHDLNINKIFIARDYFGEKPLYYSQNENSLIWASELKSIIPILSKKPTICKTGLNIYFQLTYIPAPYTIYEGISKLEANHYLEINTENFSSSVYEIQQNFKKDIDPEISFEEAKKKTHDLVLESVASRSISDVPLGTFLSGGVDSSIVSLALANQSSTPIDTFSVGFEKKSFDEKEFEPMSKEELNKRIKQSESDFRNNRFKSSSELLSQYE
jgi:asparagine synthase (glutamine-hydrolysing)